MKVQLLTFAGCPNSAAAREMLRSVLVSAGITEPIRRGGGERPRDPRVAARVGSPTILIDGVDVGGQEPAGISCRLYRDEDGRLRRYPFGGSAAIGLGSSGVNGRVIVKRVVIYSQPG